MERTSTIEFNQKDNYTLLYEHVNNGVCVYKLIKESVIVTSPKTKKEKISSLRTEEEGFATEIELTKGKLAKLKRFEPKIKGHPIMVKNSFFESTKTKPRQKLTEDLNEYGNTPYSDFMEDKEQQIIIYNGMSETFWTIDEKVIPTIIHFCYIDGHIDNYYFKIEETLEIVKKDKNIQMLDKNILRIPDYNASHKTNTYIEFFWFPETEERFELMILAKRQCNISKIAELLGIESCLTTEEYRNKIDED